jgi:hypothetical protein
VLSVGPDAARPESDRPVRLKRTRSRWIRGYQDQQRRDDPVRPGDKYPGGSNRGRQRVRKSCTTERQEQ